MKLSIDDLGPKVRGKDVKFRVWLPNVDPDARVLVIGDFCGWESEKSLSLTYDSKSELWKGELEDLPDGIYEYACLVKTGSWYSNPSSDPFARMTSTAGISAFSVPAQKPARLDEFAAPDISELILYKIDLDNFNKNFDGVKNRVLYYLSQLGVNGLVFSPWIGCDREMGGEKIPIHYFAPDGKYGTPYDLKVMINECHKAGIAVIMDLDLHAVSPCFGFNTMYPMFDTKPMLGRLDDTRKMIFINYSDESAREFAFNVCRWWLEEYNVDGFRFLNAKEYWDKEDGDGFAMLCARVYELRKKGGSSVYLFAGDSGNFDTRIINRSFANGVANRHFIRSIHRMAENRTITPDFWRILDLNQLNFSEEKTIEGDLIKNTALNSIEDCMTHSLIVKMGVVSEERDCLGYHVGDRKNNWWKIKPYVIAQFTATGTPLIYNGQEIGENRYLPDHGPDRFTPRPIGWDYLADFAGKDLYRFHQKMILLRTRFKSLRSRNFFHYFTDVKKQIVVFKRYLDDESVVVAINFSNESDRVEISFPSDGRWHEYLDDYDLTVENEKAEVRVPARYGAIFYRE